MIAFALHARAHLEWRADFARAAGAPPGMEAEQAFLIGETAERRIAAYRAAALNVLAVEQIPNNPSDGSATGVMGEALRRAPPRAWFAGLAPEPLPPGTIRQLIIKLALLGAAVIASALVIRFFLWGAR